MRKTCFVIILLFNIAGITNAQNAGAGFDIGYTYNKKNWFNLGLSASYYNTRPYDSSLSSLKWGLWHIGGGVGFNKSFTDAAKSHVSGYVNGGLGMFLDTKVTISKFYLNPAIGINALNFGKIHIGYSIPFAPLNGIEMKGFTISFTLSFGSGGYYMDVTS